MQRTRIAPALMAMVIACVSTMTLGAVKLPGFFNDHMVLQRQMPIAVWGWAEPGEAVKVALGDDAANTTAGNDGKWLVKMPQREAGGPLTLTVSASNTIQINDVLVGEVWLCSGQSNMEWVVHGCVNAAEEIAGANFPQIRHLRVDKRPSATPIDDLKANWQVCSPQTAGGFTAAGYFMARKLHQELKVPIGLINSSWGGTRIEPWTPPVGFEMVPALKWYVERINQHTPTNPAYRKGVEDYIAAANQWVASAQKALKGNQAVEPMPAFPEALKQPTNHQEPVMLYNGMIHALVGYSMRGAIWYQGESNHGEGMMYYEKTRALVEGWRKVWGIGDFPYYYVQIAPYQYGNEPPHVLAEFWEAQAACQQIPNTGMVVINDIATLNNIHPPNKQDVGDRLARLALRRTYGRAEVVDSGPTFKSLKTVGDTLVVRFDHADGGLKTRDGKAPDHFEIIGTGAGWQTAEAKIEADTVILSHPKVKAPAAMRFAWHKLAEPNLVNGAGLPTGAFRAGEVPKPDFLSQIDDAAGYQLVYDLDLGKLPNVSYAQDNAKAAGKFDRIGYLLEVQPGNDAPRYVWVSMKAFTNDASRIGVPTFASGGRFMQKVQAMNVVSNAPGIKAGENLPGNIEFWPDNYAPPNTQSVPGADNNVYDFGDQASDPRDGYGCMQIHNYDARQTLMAINNWKAGAGADLGIGNSEGKTRDWTFTGNAGSYAFKRLRVFVHPAE